MSSRSIRVYPEADGHIGNINVPKSTTGIVAYGRGAYIGEVRGPYQSLSELATDMDNLSGGTPDLDFAGHSAAYRWCRDFMANGARKLYVVEPTLSALQTITMTGNATKKSFDLIIDKTGGAGALTLSPVPGTLSVEHPLLTKLVDGVDYIVDWSQGIVHFKTAPAAAANNIQVTWKEYTAANLTSAFVKLENYPVRLTTCAYAASDNGGYSLLSEIKTHVDACATRLNPRMGYITGYKGNSVQLLALAMNDPWIIANFNLSGYFNALITDPTTSWREFTDPTSVIIGLAAAREPWVTLHEKAAQNLNQVADPTSTEVTNLSAGFVNYFQFDGYSSYRFKNYYTFEGATPRFRFGDSGLLWIYVSDTIYTDLLNNNIIGNVQIERDQIAKVKQTMYLSLKKLHKQSAIGDPDKLYITHGVYPINSVLFDAIELDESERTPAQEAYIQSVQSTRAETVRVYYDELGWLHYLDVYLGGR